MRVLMMLVVHAAVRRYQCFVRVEVLVPRGEAQPESERHHRRRREEQRRHACGTARNETASSDASHSRSSISTRGLSLRAACTQSRLS